MKGESIGGRPSADRPAIPAFCLRGVRQVKAGILVLDGVDLEIRQQRVTAVVGPSGAGKTSLLRLLNRLGEPVEGDIEYRGRPLPELPVRQLRRRVGFVFQTPMMFAGIGSPRRAG